jgi:hypothetical protein
MYELLLHLSRRLSTGNLKNINICRLSGENKDDGHCVYRNRQVVLQSD